MLNLQKYKRAVAITENYATVTNSTFKNNYASEKGAGIYIAAKGLDSQTTYSIPTTQPMEKTHVLKDIPGLYHSQTTTHT